LNHQVSLKALRSSQYNYKWCQCCCWWWRHSQRRNDDGIWLLYQLEKA